MKFKYKNQVVVASSRDEAIKVIASFKDAIKKFMIEDPDKQEVTDYIDRFKAIKHKITNTKDSDIGYWMTRGWKSFKEFVDKKEKELSKSQQKKFEKMKGATLIKETPLFYLFKITSYEASKQYGDNTDWCITRAKDHWDKYTKDQGSYFYFAIQKDVTREQDKNYKVSCEVMKNGKIKYWDANDKPSDNPPKWLSSSVSLLKGVKEEIETALISGDLATLKQFSVLEIVDRIKESKIAISKINKKVLDIKTSFGTVREML